MTEHEHNAREKRWEEFSRFFVENKLVVFILLGVLISAGLSTAPFDWKLGGFPRDPVPVDALPDILADVRGNRLAVYNAGAHELLNSDVCCGVADSRMRCWGGQACRRNSGILSRFGR